MEKKPNPVEKPKPEVFEAGRGMLISSSKERENDEDTINELAEEYMEHLERLKMNQHSLLIVGILWVLVFLSQSTESSSWLPSGWMPFSTSGSTVDSSTEKQPLQGSRDHDNVPAQFSMASYSGKGMKSVEEANRKIADLPNSCRQNAYNNLYANCSEILAFEEQQSRLAWDLTNYFLKGSATSLPECDLKSPMIECTERLKKSSPDDHIIYSQYYHVINSICHHLP
ncbi:gamete expressed 1-like protein [Tanacetum coccineum]